MFSFTFWLLENNLSLKNGKYLVRYTKSTAWKKMNSLFYFFILTNTYILSALKYYSFNTYYNPVRQSTIIIPFYRCD